MKKAKVASKQETCGSCRFYDEGACRRFPPARVYSPPQSLDVTVWPVVRAELDWCGERQKRGV